jgi:hypothetical protein
MTISGDDFRNPDQPEEQPEGRDTDRRRAQVRSLADTIYERAHGRMNPEARRSPEYGECLQEAERLTPLEVAPFRDTDLTKQGYARAAEYRYHDIAGRLLYIAIRYEHPGIPAGKQFRQCRPAENSPTGFAPDAGKIKVPYRWKQLNEADREKPVYWPEGEKDVETCVARGLVATTAAGQQLSTVIARALTGRNVVVLVDKDVKGEENAAKAVEAFRPYAASLRVVRLPDLHHGEDVTDWFERYGGTVEDLTRIVEEEPCVIAEDRRSAIRALPFRLFADTDIPWPDYIYGTSYIRGVLSITASAGGLGKSAVVLTEALAMATGAPLLHGIAPQRPQTVWYINLEDGDNVLVPRLMALTRSYRITDEDIGDRLILDNSDMKLVLAREDERRRAELNLAAVTEIIRTIKAKQIDVVIIDPLVSAHRIPENDNNGMDVVAKALARIARETNCGLMVVHHMTKGKEERTSDNVRGASSLVNAARVVRVLNPMAKDGEAGVTKERAGFYFSMDDGKTNLASAGKRMWFERFNYEEFSFDDRRKYVVLVKDFVPTATGSEDRLANLTEADVRAAFGEGGPWRERGSGDRWAGYRLATHLRLGAGERTEKAALQQAISRVIARGWLETFDAPDEHRHTRTHVRIPRSASTREGDAPIEGDET